MNSPQPFSRSQVVLVAVVGNRLAADELHHEIGPAGLGGAGVEDLGNVRVVHQGQGLPLGLEAGDYLPRVHAEFDDFHRDFAADRFLLLGHVDIAEASLADPFEKFVAADQAAWVFGVGDRIGHRIALKHRRFEKTARPLVRGQQPLDAIAKFEVVPTGLIQVRSAAPPGAFLWRATSKSRSSLVGGGSMVDPLPTSIGAARQCDAQDQIRSHNSIRITPGRAFSAHRP